MAIPNADEIKLRSFFAMIGLGVVGAASAASFVSGFFYINYLQSLPSEINIEDDDLTTSGLIYGLVAIMQIVAFLFAIVSSCDGSTSPTATFATSALCRPLLSRSGHIWVSSSRS